MALFPWTPSTTVWDIEPLGGYNPIVGDFDRQFRRMNRQINRLERNLERDLTRAGLNAPALLTDTMSIMPNIIVDNNGQRQAQFQFDTRGFKPEDITIKTENNNRLVVSGKHEEKGEDYHHHREFHRMVCIPEGSNVEKMESRLSPQGILTIQTPYNPPAIESSQAGDKVLPIKHERTPTVAQKA